MNIHRLHTCNNCGKPVEDKDEMLCVSCKQRTGINRLDQIRFLMIRELYKPVYDCSKMDKLIETHNELMHGAF